MIDLEFRDQSSKSGGFSWIALILGMGLLSGCTGVYSSHKNVIPWLGGETVPTRMNAIWSKTTLQQPGQPGIRGVGGRVLFYSHQNQEPITVNGTMVVYAYDQKVKNSVKPARKYVFPAEQLAKHYSKSDMGHSYSFWLPWGETNGPPKQLTLIARFEPSDGAAIISSPASQHLPGIASEFLEDDDPVVTGEPLVDMSMARKETVQSAQFIATAKEDQRSSSFNETITINVPPSFVNSQGNLGSNPTDVQDRVNKEELNQQVPSHNGKRYSHMSVSADEAPTAPFAKTVPLDQAVHQEVSELSVDSLPSRYSAQNLSKLRPAADPLQTRRRLQEWLSERRSPRRAGSYDGSESNR